MTTWQNYLDMLVKTLCLDLRHLKLVEETKSGETQRSLKPDVILPTKAASFRYLWLNKDTQIHRERYHTGDKHMFHYVVLQLLQVCRPFFELLTKLHDHFIPLGIRKKGGRGYLFSNKIVFKRMHHHDNVVHGSDVPRLGLPPKSIPLGRYPPQTNEIPSSFIPETNVQQIHSV